EPSSLPRRSVSTSLGTGHHQRQLRLSPCHGCQREGVVWVAADRDVDDKRSRGEVFRPVGVGSEPIDPVVKRSSGHRSAEIGSATAFLSESPYGWRRIL